MEEESTPLLTRVRTLFHPSQTWLFVFAGAGVVVSLFWVAGYLMSRTDALVLDVRARVVGLVQLVLFFIRNAALLVALGLYASNILK